MGTDAVDAGVTETVEGWLAGVTGPEHDIAAAALTFVRESLDGAEETVKWNQPCWVVGGSNCLYLAAQDGYVNLGLFEGAALDDPAGVLEGTGTSMRHVKVRSTADLEDPSLAELVAAAATYARD